MQELIKKLFNEILEPKGFILTRLQLTSHPPLTFSDGSKHTKKFYRVHYELDEYSGSVPVQLDWKENLISSAFNDIAKSYQK